MIWISGPGVARPSPRGFLRGQLSASGACGVTDAFGCAAAKRVYNFPHPSIRLSGGGTWGHRALLEPPPDAAVTRCSARAGGVLFCRATPVSSQRTRRRGEGPPAREGVGGGVPTLIPMPVTRMQRRQSQDEPHRARIAEGRAGKARVGDAGLNGKGFYF